MYEALAQFVATMPEEKLPSLYLEDIALCAAWYESHEDSPEIRDRFAALRQIFDVWINGCEPPRTDTMGYRQQPLLRQLIKELTNDKISSLERDELDLLYFASGFARRSGKLIVFRRVLTCLAPYTKDIDHWRKHRDISPGCPALGRRLTVATAEDIKSADLRDVKTFGGLNLPIRGPVYMREGNLRIMSDVPADCTVVVDQGSCHVRGSVLGNVAATVGCEVLDNISGVVIARRGNACARDIVNQAVVISKECSVRAKSIQDPRIVFASREIQVQGNVLHGRCLARKVMVEGDYIGGDLFATEWAEAANFSNGENRALRICLVRGLSCQDYGEVLSLDASKLLNSTMKLRQRVSGLEELIEITERESDEIAGNILMYILGEEDTQNRVQAIQRKRRRQSFLDRLVAGMRSIMVAAEDRLNLMGSMPADLAEAASNSAEEQAALDDLRRELAILSNEGSIDVELQNDKDEILYLGRKLQRKGVTSQGVQQVLARLIDKCTELEIRSRELRGGIDRDEAEIERTMVRAALLERAKAECSRVEMLKQLLSAAKKRPKMDIFKQRSSDRYVKLLQRMMENRLSRTTGYQSAAKEVHQRIELARERLWNEYMVSLPDHVLRGWAVGGAHARGCFAPGVLICAWRHLLEADQGLSRGKIVTGSWENNIPVRQTYVRTEQSTIEPAGEPEHIGGDTINV